MSRKVVVMGGAGELGSHFAKLCIDRDEEVRVIDIVRFNEAWRLKWLGISDKVEYVWKSTFDIQAYDVRDAWLILDASAQPDRPLGTSSPVYTMMDNLLGPTRLLETIVSNDLKPYLIYPSSCNVFLGVPPEKQPLTEGAKPMPTNYYGWSKLAAEELYLVYHRAYDLPVFVIRTGSCYGEGMRTDQMIAKCILSMLRGKGFFVRSPGASRTYTYSGDVLVFYDKFLDNIECLDEGAVIHNGGNMENKPYTSLEMANMIKEIVGGNAEIRLGEYETGERVKGAPVMQWESSALAEKLIGWRPEHSTADGLRKTIDWFKGRLEEYI